MGEVEVDQRLRDLQREYLDFLDDEVLRFVLLLFCIEVIVLTVVTDNLPVLGEATELTGTQWLREN
jgi:hypothetical protein